VNKKVLSVIAAILILVFLPSGRVWGNKKYYQGFIEGKTNLGFKPSSLFVNEIHHYILNRYPTEVKETELFNGAKRELRFLVEAYGLNPSGVDSLPASGQVLNEFLKKYRGQVSQDLAVYACGLGMVKSLQDQECELILPSVSQNPRRDIIPEGYGGIGILMEDRNNTVVVIHPFKDGPGAKAGIKAGDQILSIDGVLVKEMDLDKAMNKLRGEIGSSVNVKLQRGSDIYTRNLKREKVKTEAVYAGVSKDGTGYLRILYFSEDYPVLVYNALEMFRKKGVKKWILDLRDNAGGSLNPFIVTGSLFVPEKKPVMVIKYRDKETEFPSEARYSMRPPTAVVVNGYTTGTAEALASLFREYHDVKIFGTTTRGNAAVSEYFKLSGGATLKLTVGAILTGNKKPLHKTGVNPDFRLPDADDPGAGEALLSKVFRMIK
jgi:carboxyl-terminal processing protease